MSESTPAIQMDTVILGGGFAGAYCARTIGKCLSREEAKKTALISEENYLVFQPMLPEVAGSALASNAVVNPLRTFARGVTVFKGRVVGCAVAKAFEEAAVDGGHGVVGALNQHQRWW